MWLPQPLQKFLDSLYPQGCKISWLFKLFLYSFFIYCAWHLMVPFKLYKFFSFGIIDIFSFFLSKYPLFLFFRNSVFQILDIINWVIDSLISSLILPYCPSFFILVNVLGHLLPTLRYLSPSLYISVICFYYDIVNIQLFIFILWISFLTEFYSCFMNDIYSLFSLKILIMDF